MTPPTSATATARAGLQAYNDSLRMDLPTLVGQLRLLLGARLVAYLGEVKETRAVAQWASGDRQPSTLVQTRLRTAYQVAGLLAERDAPAVVQAWFLGLNPQLGDIAPAKVLREDSVDVTAAERVLAAARVFSSAA